MPHIDVLPTGTSLAQPGYALVPDTRHVLPSAAAPVGGRKRAARSTAFTGGDPTVRQQTAVLKHLADLDKDSLKDVQIPVPKEGAGRGSKSKTTSNVRRILLSQKTFANHLADEEAAIAQKGGLVSQTQPGGHSAVKISAGSEAPPAAPITSLDVADSPESDPLLRTYAPSAPSAELMHALVTAPPLSYNAARGTPPNPARPPRHFCEICGYWGTVKCMRCGVRVCGLECKGQHDEMRCLRYYAG